MSDFGFYTADELFNKQFESREPLIEQILYEKDSVLFAGKAKTGKSVLLFNLICSLTSGEPFLDRFEVRRKCRVLYVQLEGSLSDSQDRFRRMTKALPMDRENFFLLFSPPLQLNNVSETEQLIKRIEESAKQVDVVIIDPVYFAMKGSLSDDEAVRDFTGCLRLIQEKFNCAMILVHHFKKSRRDKDGCILPPDDDDVFGSVFFQAWITHQFLFDMDRSSKARTLQCNLQRSGKIVDRVMLNMVEPDPLYFEELAQWPTKPDTIVKFFVANPERWYRAKEAYTAMGLPKSSFYKHIKQVLAVGDGIISRFVKDEREFGFFKKATSNCDENRI